VAVLLSGRRNLEPHNLGPRTALPDRFRRFHGLLPSSDYGKAARRDAKRLLRIRSPNQLAVIRKHHPRPVSSFQPHLRTF